MNVYVDKKFVNFLSASLDKFAWKKDNLANCRCPICGDSQTNPNKCRGYFFEKEGSYYYKCHNCGASLSLYSFMEKVSPALVAEYQLERYKNNQVKKPRRPKVKATGVEDMLLFSKKKYKEKVNSKYLTAIDDLDKDHPAVQFVNMRKIPSDKRHLLYFTDDFGSFSKELSGEQVEGKESRIILPFFDKEGNMVAAQGRALFMRSVTGSIDRSTEQTKKLLRYITIKSKDAPDRLWFGQWRVNPDKKIYVVEGPIDSLFLDNCIAMVGASGFDNIPKHLKKSDGVYILDNEPRNKHICDLNKKLIDNGRNVCIWPESMKIKDINDMVIAGMSIREIKKIIDENTFSGLEAVHRLNEWRKA